ncbi:ceramidase domain-containing protein [Alkalilacustris brevis]|uniref:ceramidase domain-containing protein n=1 Tax=Alkalilacustris brevis TaxID=2026338 RepID=UPI000E0D62C8|nr:ceramidase domain-containing protein [Alkalilacustris brevis]
MDWTQQVIAYCERGDFGFWAEPVNAVTNAAFLAAAAVMAWRLRGLQGMALAWAMVAVLAAIGGGSFLWHTHAARWAGLMDVLPILLFILLYVFAATRDFLGLRWYWAVLAVLLFLPYAAAVSAGLGRLVPGLGANGAYASVALLIVIYALALRPRHPETALGLLTGAAILAVSLGFRMLDGPVCDVFPLGTHFMWHLLNAAMLGWMIEVYRRHRQRVGPA